MYNYWKCRVSRRPKAVKRRWIVTVIETDAVVIRCGTWERAVRKAIKFQRVQNKMNGMGWNKMNGMGWTIQDWKLKLEDANDLQGLPKYAL